jgi:hypothetical protein
VCIDWKKKTNNIGSYWKSKLLEKFPCMLRPKDSKLKNMKLSIEFKFNFPQMDFKHHIFLGKRIMGEILLGTIISCKAGVIIFDTFESHAK